MSAARASEPRSSRRRPRSERIGVIDIAASALVRVLPRQLEPVVSRARLDARSLVQGLRGERTPSFSTSERPLASPVPLRAIDPIVEVLPRRLGDRYLTLRRDLAMVAGELRGERAPALVPRSDETRRGGATRSGAAPVGTRYGAPSAAVRAERVLRVVRVRKETADASTFELADPSGAPIRFEAGQFLTLHVEIEGRRYRRAYSLSSSPGGTGTACITVKRIAGGRVSGYLVEHVRVGDVLTVHGPSGSFVVPPASAPRHLVLFAGGSGITPIASITRDVLRREPATRLTLVYGNRRESDVIFRDELAALAEDGRLRVVHVLSEPTDDTTCVRGILDRETVARLLEEHDLLTRANDEEPPRYLVCGPSAMMTAVRQALEARGVPADRILEERFLSPADPGAARVASGPQLVNVRLRGATHAVTVTPGKTVLEAALEQGVAMPFSCQMGGCGACKCKQAGGEIVMDEPNCLSDDEKAHGVVLACVARPLGPSTLEVG